MTNWVLALMVALGCAGDGVSPIPPPAPPPPPPPGVFPQLTSGFHPREMKILGITYKYQIFVPLGYTPSRTWPVVLYLHSSGGRGSDGVTQTSGFFGNWLRGAGANLQAVVVFPQWPMWSESEFGNGLPPWISTIPLTALDSTLRQVRADSARLYLTGWSMGAMGGWKIAYEQPNRFAAFMPLSGAVSPFWLFNDLTNDWRPAQAAAAQRLKLLPIWTFVGSADEARLLAEFRATVQAFVAAGANIRANEFAGAPHNIEDRVYPDPAVWQWLFAQHR